MNKNLKFKKQLDRVIEQKKTYLDLLNPEKFIELHKLLIDGNLDPLQRESNFVILRPFLVNLKEIFKKIIIGRNELAKVQGHLNYLEFYLAKSGIPRRRYNFFAQHADEFMSMVHNDFPATELFKELKTLTEFIFPYPTYPYGYLKFSDGFNSPDDVISKISEYDLRLNKYRPKIRIARGDNEFFSDTIYIPKEDVAEIKLNRSSTNSQERSLIFAHECGHALDMLENVHMMHNKTKKRSDYLLEYEADKFAFKFITQLPKNTQRIIRYNFLREITFALFEIDTYSNDQQDFDAAFARAINRCYLKASQSKNPFYILNKGFVGLPLDDLIHSINYVEFYLKD